MIGLAVFLAVSRPINLFTADLGRHLKNGEIVLRQGLDSQVLTTSYYSYTHPDFPAINHHWLFGVMAYGLWRMGGFTLLSVVNGLAIACGVVIMVYATRFSQKKWGVLVAVILCFPLLVSRFEVRPETLSFLWAAIYWLILTRWQKGASPWWLVTLIPLQIIWTNSHIFFPLGLAIMAGFGVGLSVDCLIQRDRAKLKSLQILAITGLTSLIASLFNPFGWKLVVAPLTLFTNYNYLVVENQSPFFLIKQAIATNLQYYVLGFVGLCALSLLLLWWKRRNIGQLLPLTLIMVLMIVGGLKIMRVYPYLGLFALPVLATSVNFLIFEFANITKYFKKRYIDFIWPVFSLVFLAILFLIIKSGLFLPNPQLIGWGLMKNSQTAGRFFNSLSLKGHVFNNYDIGGYLIHQLPDQSVFIDNRPAEYPGEFFDEYKLAQTDDHAWQNLVKKYHITSIFFYRHDLTPWAQQFLIARSQDPDWIPVYVDSYSIIFVSQIPANQAIIDKYQLDRSIFQVVKNDG